MSDPLSIPNEEQDAARCPIPDWALRPLAILLPLLLIAAIVWFILR